MKKEKQETKRYDKGQIFLIFFVKVMAGILALLMLLAGASTLIFALM